MSMPTPKIKAPRPAPKTKEPVRMRQEVAPENRIRRFWRETLAELRKVVWPTRDQAINLTLIVVATVVAMSAFLFVIDYALAQVVRAIIAP
jgi:preprotein translocase subunit SecE